MTNCNRMTQCRRIVDYLKKYNSITNYLCLQELGILSPTKRISELRRMGYPIDDKQETVTNRYGEKCYVKRYYFDKEKLEKTLDLPF